MIKVLMSNGFFNGMVVIPSGTQDQQQFRSEVGERSKLEARLWNHNEIPPCVSVY